MLRRVSLIVFLLFLVMAIYVAVKPNRTVTTSSSEAYRHYQAGVRAHEELYLRQAMEEFEKAIQLDSQFAMAETHLADVYGGLGFAKKAEEMRARAIAHKAHTSPREQLLIDCYQAGWERNNEKSYQIAQELYRQYPEDLDAISTLAHREWGLGNFDRALELFQQITKRFPDHAPSYNMLGYLNYYLGRYDDALAMLDKYIELSRDQANPHDSRGEILHALGRYDEAINEFRQAFNINPDFDFAVLHLAQTYQTLGQNRQVEYCFNILRGQAPNEAKARQYTIHYASRLAYRDELDSAKRMMTSLVDKLAMDKDDAVGDAAFSLGALYYRQRNLDSLRQIWEGSRAAMAERTKKVPAILETPGWKIYDSFMRATEADLSGNLDDAARLFAEIIALAATPDEKMSYRIYYSDVLLRRGETAQAISELQKNLSINPNSPKTLIKLAEIYDAGNDRASAQAYRERAAEVWKNADPDFRPLLELKKKLQEPLAASAAAAAARN